MEQMGILYLYARLIPALLLGLREGRKTGEELLLPPRTPYC